MSAVKTTQKQTIQTKQPKKEHQFGFVFTKTNIYIMLAGIAFLILGYVLMIGGKSDDPNVFNKEIFNAQRITVAPILLVIGFILELVAIMYRPKQNTSETNTEINK